MREFFKNSFPYFKKTMPVQVLAILFGLFRVVILLVTPQVISLLVDRVVTPLLGGESKNTSSIFYFLIKDIPADNYIKIFWVLAATLLVFAVLFFIFFYLKWQLAHYFSLKSEGMMRADALKKLGNASGQLLSRYTAGDLILITTKDPFNVRDLYIQRSQGFADCIFYIVVAAVLLGCIHWTLLFLPLAGGIFCIFVILLYKKRIKVYYESVWRDSATLSTTVQESIYGVRTVASFAREDEREALFDADNERLKQTEYGGINIFAYRDLLIRIARVAVFLGTLAIVIWLGVREQITAGEFTATMGYLGSLMWQFNSFVFNVNASQRDFVSGKRLFDFLNADDEIADLYGERVPSAQPSIRIEHLSVKNEGNYALEDVSVDIPYGKKLGIMGKTGSGKTLLCKLMQGLAEADEGEIYIDGVPIHEYSRDALLKSYSYALQNVFLFSNTIASNIALYDPFADREKVERAGKLAEVDEFASRCPDGYQTTIGEKGFGLSGGQKQRISIARALFKNAAVFVFDDVTSALDLETEHAVLQNLARECAEKTTILVTHRATALKDCDEILFLEDGKITERGSFEELMSLGGNFAQIYNRQAKEMAFTE